VRDAAQVCGRGHMDDGEWSGWSQVSQMCRRHQHMTTDAILEPVQTRPSNAGAEDTRCTVARLQGPHEALRQQFVRGGGCHRARPCA
jgi:hypothetical protein